MDDASQPARTAPSSPTGEAGSQTESGSGPGVVAPVRNDPPTVISGRAPVPSPATCDSVERILAGRVIPGDRLGSFELVEFIGGGGMGKVFRATDTRLSRTVALKILAPEQSVDADALQRFQNEAQSAARLDHDNIARVYYVGEDRGLHFIVFEYVEGVNVRILVERKGPLPLAEAVSYTLQSAEALAHSDARAVVHRDIKPSNLLITPEGRVKLIDMGLARLRLVDPEVAELTASGVTLGTFDYISPEQARDPRSADIRSDIYSLGCTFFFMLAGQPPFPQGTVLQKLLQHQGDQPPDIRELRPDLPDDVPRILQKMMAKDPRHRYTGPIDLAGELLALAERIGLRPLSPTSRVWLVPPEPKGSLLRGQLPWMAPIAALVCIVALLHLFVWSPPASSVALSGANGVSSPPRSTGDKPGSRGQPAASPVAPTPRLDSVGSNGSPSSRAGSEAADTQSPASSDLKTGELGRKENSLGPEGGETGGGPRLAGGTQAATQSPRPLAGDRATAPPRAELADQSGLALTPLQAGISSVPGTLPPSDLATDGSSAALTLALSGAPSTNGNALPGQAKPAALLVVGQGNGENQYATLTAACAAAHDGDEIELRFNGPRLERPIKLSNLRVTVRGGAGYRPVIAFRPNESDPVKYPRSMFTLTSGRLRLVNLAIELETPRDVATDSWSLFETRGGPTVRLERCALSISNASDQLTAYHPDVAFFRAGASKEPEGLVDSSAATPLATLDLADCIARGEAVFLRVEDLQPVLLSWDNGLLATTEQLLSATGAQSPSKPDEILRLELRHLTAAVRGGLCRLRSGPADPRQLTLQFVCNHCIFLGAPGVPLVEQEGAANSESFRQHLVWNGDGNYYQDFDTFWTIRNLDPEKSPETSNFEAWKSYWGPSRENQPSTAPLTWRAAASLNRPLHSHTPADYTLDDRTAADGGGAVPGALLSRLPPLPAAVSEGAKRNANRPIRQLQVQ